ncbi:FAD-binding protein [Candidatus Bathyarchaeota archaeon]|nr:MAG: FAD-binding protein [Candidatus Bathyarchaeota archaeon]
MKTLETDVLVIGGGAAGLRAAIEAVRGGVKPLVVCKGKAGYNTTTAVSGGGLKAAVGGASVEEHIEDTLRTGRGLNDRRLVEVLARESSERVLELRDFGIGLQVGRGGVYVGDTPGRGGLELALGLRDYALKIGVGLLEDTIITRILLEDGKAIGAVGYSHLRDEAYILSARAVILATGGAGALYLRNDCPRGAVGDGYSLAYQAGARLRDMEFIQFFPLALAEEGFPPFLIGGRLSEEGRLLNALGEDIVEKYAIRDRPLVLRARDLLSRAIMTEIKAGRGVDGAVLLDVREVLRGGLEGWFSTASFRTLLEKLRAADRPVKVAPICHFTMGGVAIDEWGQTDVEGLYAAGEVVGGVHGANRHGGNALTSALVFGARAGRRAAEYARETSAIKPIGFEELQRYESLRGEGVEAEELLERLRRLMWSKVGILREGEELREALREIGELREEAEEVKAETRREMLQALELPMALETAEMICRSALMRTESRGAHYRVDYPEEDESWLRGIYLQKRGGEMRLHVEPLSSNA